MKKYFDKNLIAHDAMDVDDIQPLLWQGFQTLIHNVEVKEAMPHLKRRCIEGREGEMEANIASSALMMVAACEALLSKLDPEAVETAWERVEKKLADEPDSDFESILRAALGL